MIDDGLDVDSLLVITYTDRAAGELRARIRARLLELGPPRPRARPRRRLDLDDPRLLPPAAHRVPARGRASTRGSACSTSRRRACCRARRSTSRWRRSAPPTSPTAGSCSRPTGRAGLRKMLVSVYDTLRSAGPRARCSSPAPARASPTRSPSCSPRRSRCLADDEGDRPAARRRRATCSTCSQTTRLPERLIELPDEPPCAGRARSGVQRRAQGRAGARARGARLPRPRAAAGAADRASRARTPRRRTASRRSTSRTCSSARRELLRDARRRSGRSEQLRFRSIMVDEFQDTNQPPDRPDRPALRRPGEGAVLRRRRVPVDLRVPARRRGGVPRAPRGGAAGAAADAELPLAARGARGRERAVRGRVRRRASRRSTPPAGYGDPVFGTPVELLVTDKASYCRLGRPLAARRGAARRAPRARARRRRRRDARARSCCSSPPAPTPSGSRRSCARSTCRRSG